MKRQSLSQVRERKLKKRLVNQQKKLTSIARTGFLRESPYEFNFLVQQITQFSGNALADVRAIRHILFGSIWNIFSFEPVGSGARKILANGKFYLN